MCFWIIIIEYNQFSLIQKFFAVFHLLSILEYANSIGPTSVSLIYKMPALDTVAGVSRIHM
jgi:hypothetical protein